MPDKYVEKQLQFYQKAETQEGKDNALYRLGTHLEVIPCTGDTKLSQEDRRIVLDLVKEHQQ